MKFGLCLLAALLLTGCTQQPEPRPTPRPVARPKPPSPFDQYFWQHWNDGKVEVCRYTWSRGALKGTAASYVRLEDDRVLRMVLLKRAGEMSEATEVRMPLDGAGSMAPGAVAGVSVSNQSPDGHSWAQAVFGPKRAFASRRATNEPDLRRVLELPETILPAEAAALWARRIGWPRIKADTRTSVLWLENLADFHRAALSRSDYAANVQVDNGTRLWFEVHPALPHHIKSWQTSAGETAELLGCERVQEPTPPTR